MTVETFTFTGPELDALLAKRSLHDIEETNRRANASWALMCEKMVAAEREAMVAEAAKRGWAMKNDDPFEDAVREITDARARSQP